MTWNWEQPDWPEFSWSAARLRLAEDQFLIEGGLVVGVLRHLTVEEREQHIVESIGAEAGATSQIEGEILDRASVQSSIRRELGLESDRRRAGLAEQGIAEMMVDLHRSYGEPLSDRMLGRWHRALLKGRGGIGEPGAYRTTNESMQIVSGAIHDPKVHFEAPPSARVPSEMARFIEWFNESAPGGSQPLPALTRAAIAHLYFESIHPFEDGNGRLGRAISEKALAQSVGHPTLSALAATLLLRRKSYYATLESASKTIEISEWTTWFACIAIEAQRRTEARLEFLLDKARLLDRLRDKMNKRQEKAMLRMFREGPEGFKGGMSAGNYATITNASPATATRDLAELVNLGALNRSGERRHARYQLAVPLRPVQAVFIDEHGNLNESALKKL